MGSRENTTEDFVKLEQVTKVYQMGEVQILQQMESVRRSSEK